MTDPAPELTDEERVKLMARTIDEVLNRRWSEIDELWMREIRPVFRDMITDEDFIKRIATPLSMRLISIGIQAGIQGLTSSHQVFDKPFRVVVAPSGQVSIRFD
ncbi:MAG: hypothetical protein IT303_02925 [Dehalococcoidia bacterium]|nr:hypothetical protein [Dehalococcoidia bacterium]